MTKNKGAGRPKIQYDAKEITEIIELKLKSVDYDISKLTYNSVFKYNQYLVKNKKRNSSEKIFSLYGYTFWAADYKGQPNFGKEQVDLYKQHNIPLIAGDYFEAGTHDIEAVIDNNIDNPKKMKSILIKIFQKERSNNARNDKKFNEMQQEVKEYKNLANQYKQAIFMMFYNSRFSDNSLTDVVTLQKDGDTYVQNEILHIFEGNPVLIDEIAYSRENAEFEKLNNSIGDNILDLAKILNDKKD